MTDQVYAADFDKDGKGLVMKCDLLTDGSIHFTDEAAFEDCPEELKGRTIIVKGPKALKELEE